MESKNWCFTLNNYTSDEVKDLKGLKCRYIVLGFEKGEKNGTEHIQGFIQFEKKVRLTKVKKINKRIHWEIMKSNVESAINYCKKDGVFEERGEVIKQGKRNDLLEAKAKVRRSGMRSILGENEEYNLQCIKVCEKMLTYCEKERDFKPEVIWIYGESGKGKTKYINKKCAEVGDAYWHDGTQWWDGYDAHSIVVMDDFRGSNMKMNYLLKLIDRYPHRVQVKGGYRQMLAKTFYISSIEHPKDIYKLQDEPIKQLLRRIDEIIPML